ncbi:MAG TPA: EAL domain-containing protein, partial [Acidimicrobiales bacterium]|nr:EAL domain-containing protein [Acidimicrobiales bacterium]
LPTGALSAQLTAAYGGAEHDRFAVTSGSVVLGTSGKSVTTNPVANSSYLYGSAPVTGFGWRVYAGALPSVALANTYSSLDGEGLVAGIALVFFLLLLAVIRVRIAHPLRDLSEAVGDSGPHLEQRLRQIAGTREVAQLARSFGQMVSVRDAYEDRLAHQALHDSLTSLPNRALFQDRLNQALASARRRCTGVGMLFIDVDRFKLINDGLGHSAGDQVLAELATRLARAVRDGDTLARFGGDEFVIVCEDLNGSDEIVEVANRVQAVTGRPVEVANRIIRVTVSIGIAIAEEQEDADGLIRDADTAMYAAKSDGGAGHRMFDVSLHERAKSQLVLENELREAGSRRELSVAYQPLVDLGTGEITGVEALLRWVHPAIGYIPPTTFIPLAEETGLINTIGTFVLEEACGQAARWNESGHPVKVSVNVSGRQVVGDDLVGIVAKVLRDTGLPARHLCLELTESVFMADSHRLVAVLDQLRALGVDISIDDFGTGYSSLSRLQRLPVDELKIDRTFVKEVVDRPAERSLVGAMVAMGKALGLRVVAEGVETEQQAEELRRLGCQEAQGFLFSRPAPGTQISELLAGGPLVNPPRTAVADELRLPY